MVRLVLILFTLAIGFPNSTYACEPCSPSAFLTLDEIVQKAELIVIGKRHNPPWFDDNNSKNGPAVIQVEVERVLKGRLDKNIIKTASWYGRCDFGVILHKERALLLLRKEPEHYSVVNPVCGGNQFNIIDNQLTRKKRHGNEEVNVPFISVAEFINKYIEKDDTVKSTP